MLWKVSFLRKFGTNALQLFSDNIRRGNTYPVYLFVLGMHVYRTPLGDLVLEQLVEEAEMCQSLGGKSSFEY